MVGSSRNSIRKHFLVRPVPLETGYAKQAKTFHVYSLFINYFHSYQDIVILLNIDLVFFRLYSEEVDFKVNFIQLLTSELVQ